MLTASQLETLVDSRREEAVVLLDNGKFDGAVYLAGYAVELSLKLAILKNGFPEIETEFNTWKEAKTHDLNKLLALAGKNELREDDNFSPDWDLVVKKWSAECRYRKIGAMTDESARMTLDSVSRIIERLKAD